MGVASRSVGVARVLWAAPSGMYSLAANFSDLDLAFWDSFDSAKMASFRKRNKEKEMPFLKSIKIF
jgi:hypothetical protein